MFSGEERRSDKRNHVEFPVVFTDWRSNAFFTAVIQNHSTGGIHFKSDTAVEPGSDILIRAEDSLSEENGRYQGGYRCRAVVIWCKENPDEDSYRYIIGAEYYEPQVQYKYKQG